MPPFDVIKKSLVFIDLSSNKISLVQQNYFEGYIHLKHLYFARNHLSNSPNVQSLNRTLMVLDLTFNNITALSGSLIDQEFKMLHELLLGSNILTTFDISLLSLWPSLRLLSLSFNPLTTVPDISSFNITRSQRTILHFSSSQTECSSNIAWLFDGLQKNESIGHFYQRRCMRIEGFEGSECAKPKCLKGRIVGFLSKS